jgi:hypothetical protein
MRYFVMTLLTGLVGLTLAGLAGNMGTRAHHVSDFEGARGYLVVFLLAPAGGLVGAVVGALLAMRVVPGKLGSLAVQQAWALLITSAPIGAALGIALLTAQRPVEIDGRQAVLELEVRLPLDPMGETDINNLTVSLYASRSDNYYVDLDTATAQRSEGFMIVGGRTPLRSRTANRSLLVGLGLGPSRVIDLPLEASPRKVSDAWSPWLAAKVKSDLSPVAPADVVEARYRVR